jgi:ABC-type lipoprotein export system ATPase subunit
MTDVLDGYAVETMDLWRVYKTGAEEVAALQGVSFRVRSGRFVAVKGPSGSGKTTLINCIGGLDHPTSGVVRVFEQDLSQLGERGLTRWRHEQVGFVFQSFGLLPTLSAYENVELMLRIGGVSGSERRERSLRCLELVGLGGWAHHRPYEMSGGQQQRVGIARALVSEPRLILADEPTGELDSETARDVLSLFRRIVKEERTTVLVVSHDPLVNEYVDEVRRLRDGQIA